MNKHLKGAVVMVIVSFVLMTLVFLVAVVIIRGQSIAQYLSGGAGCTAEAAMKKSADSLKNTATFKYAGIGESVKLVKIESAGQDNSWKVVYSFQTRHPGHSNRPGQALAQVITDHTVELNLKDCKIISAICDNNWDLINDKSLR
jgi:hypothetical protein